MADKTYIVKFTTSGTTQNPISFTIPDKAGNYKLTFNKQGGGSFITSGPNIKVSDTANRYRLRFSLSDGQTIDAGTFITPIASTAVPLNFPFKNLFALFTSFQGSASPYDYYSSEYTAVNPMEGGYSILAQLGFVEGGHDSDITVVDIDGNYDDLNFSTTVQVNYEGNYITGFEAFLRQNGCQDNEAVFVFSDLLTGAHIDILKSVMSKTAHLFILAKNPELRLSRYIKADYVLTLPFTSEEIDGKRVPNLPAPPEIIFTNDGGGCFQDDVKYYLACDYDTAAEISNRDLAIMHLDYSDWIGLYLDNNNISYADVQRREDLDNLTLIEEAEAAQKLEEIITDGSAYLFYLITNYSDIKGLVASMNQASRIAGDYPALVLLSYFDINPDILEEAQGDAGYFLTAYAYTQTITTNFENLYTACEDLANGNDIEYVIDNDNIYNINEGGPLE